MKKNNHGFFLIEAIVVITIITTIMAFVFPNVSNLYDNFKRQSKYYDQPEDLITLRSIYEVHKDKIIDATKAGPDNNVAGCKIFGTNNVAGNINNESYAKKIYPFFPHQQILVTMQQEIYYSQINLRDFTLYLTGYTTNLTSTDPDFNLYLSRMKKNVYNPNVREYRLIAVFGPDTAKRYASIKIEDPNPNAGCE